MKKHWHTWLAIAFVILLGYGCKTDGIAHDIGQNIRNLEHKVTGH